MAGDLQPLDEKFVIVGPDGRPTLYFIQWCQQRQIDITDALTLLGLEEYLLAHKLQEGSGIQITPSGNLTDEPTIAADAQEILDQISTTRGTVLYRGLGGWAALAPGTAGNFLKTNGAGADPAWASAASAVLRSQWAPRVSGGGRYLPCDTIDLSTGTATLSADTIYYHPFTKNVQIDAVVVEVTTLSAGNVKAALYDSNSTGFPTNKLYESGGVSTGSTGNKILTLGATYDVTDLVWLALVFSGTPTLRAGVANSAGFQKWGGGATVNTTTNVTRMTQAISYATGFPATTSGAFTFNTNLYTAAARTA